MSKTDANRQKQGDKPGQQPTSSNIFHHEHLLDEHHAHFHFLTTLFHPHDPRDHDPSGRFRYIYPVVVLYCLLIAVLGLVWDGPAATWAGLKLILFTPDVLITDYVALAGLGAALVNSALVTLAAVAVLWLTRAPLAGSTISTLGLLAGFSLFGNDLLNIWPIIVGALLYAVFRREPLWKYASTGLMATCLSPIVSAFWFGELGWPGILMGTLVGVMIGFLIPLLAAYTFLLLRGMNLYNVGFACGLMALVIVPVMAGAGVAPSTVLIWATGYNAFFAALLLSLSALAVAVGVFLSGGVGKAVAAYRALLDRTGRPSDFLTSCGAGTTLVNMGLCGLLCTGYLLLIGGDLNGPTVGAVLTVVGFAANGKHLGSISSLMAGAALAALLLPGFSLTTPVVQFSVLFCTTLAPLSGTFGFPVGLLAGFLHICAVQRTGAPVCGLNLYNNGFTGGVVSIVLYPMLVFLKLHHPAGKQEEDAEELDHLTHHHLH